MTTELHTADIELYDGGTQAIIVGGQMVAYQDFAKAVAVSTLLPAEMRGKPADVLVVVLQGLDLGMRPMQAFGLIDVIKGKPCLKAEGKRALVLAAGHGFRVVEWTDDKCVVEGRRRGTDEWQQATFTREQAKKAGLSGDNWTKYPADMLLARATSRLCKAYFADVTNGLATSEEMFDDRPERPTLMQIAAERADKPAPSDAELREAVTVIEHEAQKARDDAQPTLDGEVE